MIKQFFFFFITLWISAQAFAKPNDHCHPQANANLPQYIIGYGSLIETASKKATDETRVTINRYSLIITNAVGLPKVYQVDLAPPIWALLKKPTPILMAPYLN